MPVVILLDTSLSMNQNVYSSDCTITRLNLALHGLQYFLDCQANNNKLDLTSLIFFSATCKTISKFTRDYDSLKNSLQNINTFDKTNLIMALKHVRNQISEEWGCNFSYHVLIITDGNAVLQSSFLNKNISSSYDIDSNEYDSSNWPLPLPFKSKIHIVCMTNENEPSFKRSLPFYKEIISRNSSSKSEINVNIPSEGGQIWVSNAPVLTSKGVEDIFFKLSSEHLKPHIGRITCGNMSCPATLYPNLTLDQPKSEFCRNSTTELSICGFLNIDEIASPPVLSRHLVLPMSESLEEFKKWLSFINLKSDLSDEELLNMFNDEGRQPSFGVLLHGSLKVANMMALCQINSSSSWYGVLYSGTDHKKKSSLMLSVFEPGLNSVPWISNFTNLGIPKPEESDAVKLANASKKPSNYVVWLHQAGIQADVQKILRYARKLPDKYEALISEITRIKKTTAAFNFVGLVEIITKLLEREANLLPGTAHPDAITCINQVIRFLKQPCEMY